MDVMDAGCETHNLLIVDSNRETTPRIIFRQCCIDRIIEHLCGDVQRNAWSSPGCKILISLAISQNATPASSSNSKSGHYPCAMHGSFDPVLKTHRRAPRPSGDGPDPP